VLALALHFEISSLLLAGCGATPASLRKGEAVFVSMPSLPLIMNMNVVAEKFRKLEGRADTDRQTSRQKTPGSRGPHTVRELIFFYSYVNFYFLPSVPSSLCSGRDRRTVPITLLIAPEP
jgi:hypothetical protein